MLRGRRISARGRVLGQVVRGWRSARSSSRAGRACGGRPVEPAERWWAERWAPPAQAEAARSAGSPRPRSRRSPVPKRRTRSPARWSGPRPAPRCAPAAPWDEPIRPRTSRQSDSAPAGGRSAKRGRATRARAAETWDGLAESHKSSTAAPAADVDATSWAALELQGGPVRGEMDGREKLRPAAVVCMLWAGGRGNSRATRKLRGYVSCVTTFA